MNRNLTNNTNRNKLYVDSGNWKCQKSPTGAHHWIVNQGHMVCKYCDDNRQVSLSTDLKYPG